MAATTAFLRVGQPAWELADRHRLAGALHRLRFISLQQGSVRAGGFFGPTAQPSVRRAWCLPGSADDQPLRMAPGVESHRHDVEPEAEYRQRFGMVPIEP